MSKQQKFYFGYMHMATATKKDVKKNIKKDDTKDVKLETNSKKEAKRMHIVSKILRYSFYVLTVLRVILATITLYNGWELYAQYDYVWVYLLSSFSLLGYVWLMAIFVILSLVGLYKHIATQKELLTPLITSLALFGILLIL